jgi:TolB-like protein
MAEERVQRRLAAILAADVVGFSRLMEIDETTTMATLKARWRDVLDPLVARHQGRIFKTTGDGVLVEFASAVNAVQCAVDLQRGMAVANSGELEARHIVLRIGVNLGDVMVEGSDLYGDGINVAARLENLAEPGSICLSAMVHQNVKTKLDLVFEDLGEQRFKNFAEPVRTYRVIGTQAVTVAAPKLVTDKPSIAVLPFTNMSGDPDQEYFSDGITEDIITEISKYHQLLVIARNSSFQFRGKAKDVKEVARKLGVQFVLEGSVRRAGNRVRVTAQLIEVETSAHVWAERYDRSADDIFDLQDGIVQMVTSRVSRQMIGAIVYRARTKPTTSLSAYECYVRASQFLSRYDTMPLAVEPARRAVELDPKFAGARAVLSFVIVNESFLSEKEWDTDRFSQALALGNEAVSLDPNEPLAHAAVGFALKYLGRLKEARPRFDEAVSLNPNDTVIRGARASFNGHTGRYEEALSDIEEALRRDPYAKDWLWDVRGTIMMACGRPDEAIASYEKMKYVPPWGLAFLAVSYVELGKLQEAGAIYRRLRDEHSGLWGGQWISDPSRFFKEFEHQADRDRLVAAFRRAGAAS